MPVEKRSDGLCSCGCGEKTQLYRGKYRPFVYGHQARGQCNSRAGVRISDETREKISTARKAQGSPWWVGRKHTEASKAKSVQRHLGQVQMPRQGFLRDCEWCGKEFYRPQSCTKTARFCSTSCSASYLCNVMGNPFAGKTHTEETKEICRRSTIQMRSKGPCLPTSPERAVHAELLSRGIEFLTEFNVLNKWCVDVYIPSTDLIIFVDGCYWHACPIHCPNGHKSKRDSIRVPFLTQQGYKVACLWEHEVKEDVAVAVARALQV